MESIRVAGAADLADGSMRRVDAGGEAVLVANVGGAFFAIANTCSHRGGDLSKGTIQDGIVHVSAARLEVRCAERQEPPRTEDPRQEVHHRPCASVLGHGRWRGRADRRVGEGRLAARPMPRSSNPPC